MNLPIILGLKSQLTKGVAREALQKEIATQTGQNLGGKIMKDDSVTFGWFVRNRYYPLRDWRPETATKCYQRGWEPCRGAGDCQVPATTRKPDQSWVGCMSREAGKFMAEG